MTMTRNTPPSRRKAFSCNSAQICDILAKHGDEFDVTSLQQLLDDMKVVPSAQPDRVELESERYHATVRHSWYHHAKRWLLTAFDRTKPPSAKGRSFILDNPGGAGETPSPQGGSLTSIRPGRAQVNAARIPASSMSTTQILLRNGVIFANAAGVELFQAAGRERRQLRRNDDWEATTPW
jgi:hypothetical protein